MKKTYYYYKNDKLGCFMDPFTSPYGPEDFKEILARSVKNAKAEEHPEELSLYKAFEIDDKTGKIDLKDHNEFIISLSEFMEAK